MGGVVPADDSFRDQRVLLPGTTVVLWLAALAAFVRGVLQNAHFLHDDAFITLRYAQNLLSGNGIAWNPGDRVEGYTNFLQLMVVSGLGALGFDLVAATRGLAIVAYGALAGFLAYWLVRHKALGRDARGRLLLSLPLASIAGALPLVAWGFGGLEAPLLALCLTVGVVVLADVRDATRPGRHAVLAGIALALACMTRPDAGLFAAAGAMLVLLPVEGRVRWRIACCYVAPLVVLLAPWLAWKFFYYGDVLPNTFYVKASDPSFHRLATGLAYVGSYVIVPPFAFVVVALGTARAAAVRRLGVGQAFALGAVGLHVLWLCFIGGDQMPMHRLFVPVIPILAWLCVDLWLPELRSLSVAFLSAVAFALAVAIGLQAVGSTGVRNVNSTAFVGAAVGDYITEAWRPGSLVALNTAGSTPYHAPNFRYVDMLGLNDKHIARRDTTQIRIRGQRLPGHAKGDGAYVLDLQPDYIILGPAHGALSHQPWFLSDLEIAEDERFRAGYSRRQVRVDVRAYAHWELFPETAAGSFLFTWYERERPGGVAP